MKKVLSVLLAVLVVSLSFAFVVGAEEAVVYPVCECKDHTNAAEGCHCCVYCDNLDYGYLTHCVKKADGSLNEYYVLEKYVDELTGTETYKNRRVIEFCCTDCDGIVPSSCSCGKCEPDTDDSVKAPDQLLTEDQQQQVIDGFQSVLGRIRDFFDKLFNAIFEFLRFDEIMGA
ncbi:MAG: hypothetical protein E7543_09845 [Ruminococcaceae bacterium]|nr:hypothetical protein [Oscillospiraceae bacterium]